jgi:hypothetical protein
MNNVQITDQHIRLVRRVLGASEESYLREVGQHGKVVSLR